MLRLIFFLFLLLSPSLAQTNSPTIIINELAWMGTKNSSNDEWIELYNPTENEIDLTGWKIEALDGSPKINLIGTISAGDFFILERTDDDSLPEITANQIYTGSLSNTGEQLELYNQDNNLIDKIELTDNTWPGGDNSTKQTLERTAELNWQTSLEIGGTPKAQNSAGTAQQPAEEANNSETPLPTSAPIEEKIPTAQKGAVKINEVLANPIGQDFTDEFIEIKNVSPGIVDLSGWTINTLNQIFIINTLKMQPQTIVLWPRTQTGLTLNNTKETIKLKAGAKIIDQITIQNSAEGQAYARAEDDNWHWVAAPSPGAENNLLLETDLPIPIFYPPKTVMINEIFKLDASDSFNPQGKPLEYHWDFGNGTRNTGSKAKVAYTKTGSYEISLTVSNQTASSTKTAKIKVESPKIETEKPTKETESKTATTTQNTLESIPFIFISEFLPNPTGSDTENEFIEIFNQEPTPINLAGWQLDDAPDGSKPYTITDTIIKPGQYLAFDRTQTKIALNNSDEQVRLISPGGLIVDSVPYEESKEGYSFVLDENFLWQQTDTPTPSQINILNNQGLTEEKTDIPTTTTPKILGASSGQIIEGPKEKNQTKYTISAISALAVIGLAAGLKLKKKV